MSKKSGRKILRIGLVQNQKILEERLMRRAETVTIGHDYNKNTLVVPASNLPRSFPLFKRDGDGYLLQFTDKMEGRISRGGGVETFEALREKGSVKKKGDLYQLRMTPTMRGRVAVGEATVLFQFVTPPPKKARPVLPSSMRGGLVNGVDRSLAVLVAISAVIQVGFVMYLELNDWPVPEDQHVEVRDHMAELMGEELEEPEPEPQDEDGDEQIEEEEEDEPEPETEPEEEEMTPEEEAEARQEERVEVTERVEDATILGTLTAEGEEEGAIERLADRVGDVSADEAFDADRVETGSGLEADRLGRAGGSPDATGEGALAEGEEMGEIGEGADVDTGGREEQEVETVAVVEQTPPEDTGELDQDALNRGLRRLQNNIEACYQNYLRQNPRARGTVRVMITVTARGSRGDISAADIVADEVGGGVGECISNELTRGRVRLPAPEDGDARITIPYHFSPG